MMNWYFFPAPEEEHKLAYSCEEGDKIYKCIGHLRADFGRSGDGFWASWTDHNPELKTQEFKDVFDDAINMLRREAGEITPLRNRSEMRRCFRDYPHAREENESYCGENYIFRMDVFPDTYNKTHSIYSLIMRMNATPGIYNLYCYCYNTRELEGGLANG